MTVPITPSAQEVNTQAASTWKSAIRDPVEFIGNKIEAFMDSHHIPFLEIFRPLDKRVRVYVIMHVTLKGMVMASAAASLACIVMSLPSVALFFAFFSAGALISAKLSDMGAEHEENEIMMRLQTERANLIAESQRLQAEQAFLIREHHRLLGEILRLLRERSRQLTGN